MTRGLFVKVEVGFWDDPAVQAAGEQAAVLLLQMFDYCKANLTDGFVPDTQMPRFGLRSVDKRARNLHETALILRANGREGWLIPSWLGHNRSRAEVDEIIEKRRSAGSKGGKAKAERASKDLANCQEVATTAFYPETETETETETKPPLRPPAGSRVAALDPTAVAAADALIGLVGAVNELATVSERNYTAKALANGWTIEQLRDVAMEAADAAEPRRYLRACLRKRATDPPDDVWATPIRPLTQPMPHPDTTANGIALARAALKATKRLDP